MAAREPGIFLAGDSVLSIDGSFLFIFFSILLLIFVLNRTLFKPINRILDERERLGASRMTEAKELFAKYEERLAKYEKQVGEAKAEAFQYLETSRKESIAARQEMIAKVKEETASQITAATEDIAAQVTEAKRSLESEARGMAATISTQLLHRPVGTGGN